MFQGPTTPSYQTDPSLLPLTLQALTRGLSRVPQKCTHAHVRVCVCAGVTMLPLASYLEFCCQGVAGPLQGGGVQAFLIAL